MKRNPVYSRPPQWVFPIIVNGMVINKNAKSNSFTNEYGIEYTIWVNEAGNTETKQEKFNRIFQVEDAKLVK